jgi:hypothetical protein
MKLFSAVFCVVRGVGKFDVRRGIDDTLIEMAPDGKNVMQ